MNKQFSLINETTILINMLIYIINLTILKALMIPCQVLILVYKLGLHVKEEKPPSPYPSPTDISLSPRCFGSLGKDQYAVNLPYSYVPYF